MTNVIACIDGAAVTPAVCDYAAWTSLRLEAPLILLHVLDKSEYPIASNLTGNIGLGSREALLEELAALDQKRGRLALEQGRLMLEQAQHRVINDGVANPVTRQRHGSLIETLVEMEPETRLLVLGKHDENLNEHIGSRLENVARIMHRPILVTTDTFRPPLPRRQHHHQRDAQRHGTGIAAALNKCSEWVARPRAPHGCRVAAGTARPVMCRREDGYPFGTAV